jgi:ParB family chromosome partitioning protein
MKRSSAKSTENPVRNDLNFLQRAEHLRRWKEIYERLHPEARKGGDYGNQHTGGKSRLSDNLSFSRQAATITGQSDQTIQRLVRVGKLLTSETKRLLGGAEWADNQRTLMKICKMQPDMQEEVARKAARGESKEIRTAPL